MKKGIIILLCLFVLCGCSRYNYDSLYKKFNKMIIEHYEKNIKNKELKMDMYEITLSDLGRAGYDIRDLSKYCNLDSAAIIIPNKNDDSGYDTKINLKCSKEKVK